MDLKTLRYFVEVADLKGISRAATALRIAQPAVSRQIKKLEDDIGVELMVRTAHGIELTDAGAILLARAKTILSLTALTHKEVAEYADRIVGDVTVGISPAAGTILVPVLVKRVRQEYPALNLRIVEGFTSNVHRAVRDGRVDIGVLHDPKDPHNLVSEALLEETFYVVDRMSSWNGGAEMPKFYRVRDLESFPLMLPSRANQLRILVDEVSYSENVNLHVSLEIDSIPIMKKLVLEGFGMAILSYGSVEEEVKRQVMSAIPIHSPRLRRTLVVAHNRAQRPSNAVREVTRIIRESARELVASKTWLGSLPAA